MIVVIMRTRLTAVLVLVVLIAAAAYLYMRPLPQLEAVNQVPAPPKTTAINLPWPAGGQAALGAQGYGLLASNNTTAPVPIASIAKVITAIAVLKQKPLAVGAQGPTITLDSSDVDLFNYYYLKDGSVASVAAGEQISEYQALQAMLIPSANNMADSLARWAFGSVDAYVAYANQMIRNMGLSHTTVGDANGFSDTTTSTADDLVKLGEAALNLPVVAQITAQASAQVPTAGVVNNTNFLLGDNGIVGIKTGNTDKAGGCYLFAAKRVISGHNITLIGAILGDRQLSAAVNDAEPLIQAGDSGFQPITVVKKDQVLGYYHAPWGADAQLKSSQDLSLMVWRGADINVLSKPNTVSTPAQSGATAGMVTAESSRQTVSSPLYLAQNLPSPTITWRIFH
jgi:serine-type D-Ala-D-Ala carboxypeptidase (penicillin-binding protein 5/6)